MKKILMTSVIGVLLPCVGCVAPVAATSATVGAGVAAPTLLQTVVNDGKAVVGVVDAVITTGEAVYPTLKAGVLNIVAAANNTVNTNTTVIVVKP